MARSRDSIPGTLEQDRAAFRGFGVRSFGPFGQVAPDDTICANDLDFLVELGPKPFDAHMGMREFLEELINCRADLVLRDALKPRLRQSIPLLAVDSADT